LVLSEVQAEAVSERDAWLAARQANTCLAFLDFQAAYPNSIFSLKVRSGIAALCSEEERAAFAESRSQVLPQAGVPDADEAPNVADDLVRNLADAQEDGAVPSGPVETSGTVEVPEALPDTAAPDVTDTADVAETGPDPSDPLVGPGEGARTGIARVDVPADAQEEAQGEAPGGIVPGSGVAVALSAREAWMAVRNSDDCASVRGFLAEHDDALFALQARRLETRVCDDSDDAFDVALAGPTAEDTPTPAPTGQGEADSPVTRGDVTVGSGVEPADAESSAVASASADVAPTYVFALVNADYASEDIPDIDVDADLEAFLRTVEALGIPDSRVRVLRNPERVQTEEAAFAFAFEMEPGAALVVYYAGHSLTRLDDREQILVPVTFAVPLTRQVRLSERRLGERTIPLSALLRDLRENRPDSVTLIYNGCHEQIMPDTGVEPHWEYLSRSACQSAEIRGASVFYPVSENQVQPLPTPGAGPSDFMRLLLETIEDKPSLRLSALSQTLNWELYQRQGGNPEAPTPVFRPDPDLTEAERARLCLVPSVVDGVAQCADWEGWSGADEEGPARDGEERPVPAALPVPAPSEAETPRQDLRSEERSAWEAARSSRDCAMLTAFLDDYPGSIYRSRVESLRDRLCTEEVDEDEVPETVADTLPETVPEAPVVFPEYCVAEGEDVDAASLTQAGYEAVQQRLNDLGCDVGPVDGVWGRGSQGGFDRFLREAGVDWSETSPVCGTVERLRSRPDARVCPLVCGDGFRVEGERCVRIPQATTTTVTRTPTPRAPAPTPAPTPTPAPQPAAESCGPFQVLSNGRCVTRAFRP